MSEDAFFAVPSPGGDLGDAPILMGAPPADEPTFLGDVNEAPPTDDEPIILGAPAAEEEVMGVAVEDEPEVVMEPVDEGSTEPSPMQKWNAEWQETLMQRKEEENARKAELVEQARIAMENFHAEREKKREAKMATNRSAEQEKLEAIEADLENDNSWQRVCKMIELSHDNKADAEDVKRMRDVLILLKNEPARAEALTN